MIPQVGERSKHPKGFEDTKGYVRLEQNEKKFRQTINGKSLDIVRTAPAWVEDVAVWDMQAKNGGILLVEDLDYPGRIRANIKHLPISQANHPVTVEEVFGPEGQTIGVDVDTNHAKHRIFKTGKVFMHGILGQMPKEFRGDLSKDSATLYRCWDWQRQALHPEVIFEIEKFNGVQIAWENLRPSEILGSKRKRVTVLRRNRADYDAEQLQEAINGAEKELLALRDTFRMWRSAQKEDYDLISENLEEFTRFVKYKTGEDPGKKDADGLLDMLVS